MRQLPIFQHDVVGVVLHAGDEVHALQGQIGKPSVVVIAAVHHQQRPRFPGQLPCHPYLVLFASSDHRIAGEASWSSSRCNLTAPLVRRKRAQSKALAHRSITVASMLISLCLKRNLC
jgi:hypothetical protein